MNRLFHVLFGWQVFDIFCKTFAKTGKSRINYYDKMSNGIYSESDEVFLCIARSEYPNSFLILPGFDNVLLTERLVVLGQVK